MYGRTHVQVSGVGDGVGEIDSEGDNDCSDTKNDVVWNSFSDDVSDDECCVLDEDNKEDGDSSSVSEGIFAFVDENNEGDGDSSKDDVNKAEVDAFSDENNE